MSTTWFVFLAIVLALLWLARSKKPKPPPEKTIFLRADNDNHRS